MQIYLSKIFLKGLHIILVPVMSKPKTKSENGCSAKKQHPKKAVHIKAAINKAVPDLAVAKRHYI